MRRRIRLHLRDSQEESLTADANSLYGWNRPMMGLGRFLRPWAGGRNELIVCRIATPPQRLRLHWSDPSSVSRTMNPFRSHTFVFATLVATFAGGSDAPARPLRSRVESGVIESVDHPARVLKLRRSNRSEPLTVIWNRRTHILAKGRSTTASGLQVGKRAAVSYHTPLSNERYATKIELIDFAAHEPHG